MIPRGLGEGAAVDTLGLRLGKETTAAVANIVAAHIRAVGKAEAHRGASVTRWLEVCGLRSDMATAIHGTHHASACDECGQTMSARWRVRAGQRRATELVEKVITAAIDANPLAATSSPVCQAQPLPRRGHRAVRHMRRTGSA